MSEELINGQRNENSSLFQCKRDNDLKYERERKGSDMPSVLSEATEQWVTAQMKLRTKSNATPIIKTVERLQGGMSSNMFHIRFEKLLSEKAAEEVVLRQITNQEWLIEEPDLIVHEKAALQTADQLPIPTPQFIAADPDGTISGLPSLLMTALEGQATLMQQDRKEYLKSLAKTLSLLHEYPMTTFPYFYYPYQSEEDLILPSWTAFPQEWQALLEVRCMKQSDIPYVWIHRDFHPNNMLTKNNQVIGIVDWVNACMGPAGIDVAHCRWNLAMIYGPEAAAFFLKAYQNYSPSFAYDVYWDVVALFDVLTDPLEVYEGWVLFGPEGMTEGLMKERMDAYMLGLWREIQLL